MPPGASRGLGVAQGVGGAVDKQADRFSVRRLHVEHHAVAAGVLVLDFDGGDGGVGAPGTPLGGELLGGIILAGMIRRAAEQGVGLLIVLLAEQSEEVFHHPLLAPVAKQKEQRERHQERSAAPQQDPLDQPFPLLFARSVCFKVSGHGSPASAVSAAISPATSMDTPYRRRR